MIIKFDGPKIAIMTRSGIKTLQSIDPKDIPNNHPRFKHLLVGLDTYILVMENGIIRRYAKNRILNPDGIGSVLYG